MPLRSWTSHLLLTGYSGIRVVCGRLGGHIIRGQALLALLLVLVFGLAILAGDIYAYSHVRDDGPADAAIVLGAAIWDDQPSPVFRERINHAVDLYQRGAVRVLIFTGGVGEGGTYAESEVARAYAIERGVSSEDIVIETRSQTTYQNLMEARSLVEEEGLGRVLLVSDPLHMRRAVTMARDLGLDAYPSPTPTTRYRSWWTQARFLLRELYFYPSYILSTLETKSFHVFHSVILSESSKAASEESPLVLRRSIFGRKGEILRHFGRCAPFVPQNDNLSDDLLSGVLSRLNDLLLAEKSPLNAGRG